MIVRNNIYLSPGGDTTQILMTAKYLRELGVVVDVLPAGEVTTDYSNYDLIHFFNIIRPDDILPFIKNKNIPYCISTIFVDYSEYEQKNRAGVVGAFFKLFSSGQIEYLKAIARWLKNGDKIKSRYYLLRGHKSSMKKVLRNAAILLPNSHSEASRLFNYIGESFPYRKVVNAIEHNLFNDSVPPDTNYKNHVLCVGRIEGRKNQLNLIKALNDSGLQLTIIGKPSPNHVAYYNECKKEAAISDNVHFVEHMSHEMLNGIYKAAKVHVLPSWFETTGLSSLEAGAMGCNLVVSPKGDTKEYFADMAFYCEPDDIQSIRDAVLSAYNAPVNHQLKEHILENYTWQKAAEQTLDAYKEIVNN